MPKQQQAMGTEDLYTRSLPLGMLWALLRVAATAVSRETVAATDTPGRRGIMDQPTAGALRIFAYCGLSCNRSLHVKTSLPPSAETKYKGNRDSHSRHNHQV